MQHVAQRDREVARRSEARSLQSAAAVRNLAIASLVAATAACTANVDITTEDSDSTSGTSIGITDHLSGCHGHASTSIPSDGQYVMTTFGGGADDQPMSCGGYADGSGWYAASRQRYGCGAHLQVEANGKCVVLEAQDYGPDVCVENAANMPILDMSPRASRALYGVSGAGWSDHLVVSVTEVPSSTPLGPCQASDGGGGGGGGTGMSCSSATLDRDVDDGTCVQAASDGVWYQCNNGNWDAKSSSSGCATAYGWCDSATLGESVPPRTCAADTRATGACGADAGVADAGTAGAPRAVQRLAAAARRSSEMVPASTAVTMASRTASSASASRLSPPRHSRSAPAASGRGTAPCRARAGPSRCRART